MKINQGDVFWISPNQIASDYTHPHVVIKENISDKVIICAITSNLKRAKEPGNVLLETGEANLPKQSVIEVSKMFTIDKSQLGEYIGTLTEQRTHQVLVGIRFIEIMTQHHE